METITALLPCESRTGRNLEVIPDGTRCRGKWTRHDFDGADLVAGVAYLLYRCADCGHRRIWGTWASGWVS
jgi:hypothetical protein